MDSPSIASSRRSKSSTKSSTTNRSTNTMSNQDTVAAMRHLRSIVQSIASDENTSPTDRQQKVKNFEQLLEQAEKKLHYQNNKNDILMDDPLGLLNVGTSENKSKSNNGKKKKDMKNGEKKKKKDKKDKKEWKRKGWLKASKLLSGRAQRSTRKEMLETLHEEEDARGETDEQHERHTTTIRDAPPLDNVEVATDDDDDDNTAGGDTIADMRAQNSQDYTASICSLRSLGTFEKDFINYVMAEQEGMNDEEVSCSTFEKDFMARQNGNNGSPVYPTQVEYNTNNGGGNGMNDGLIFDDAISETTFEQDARSLEPLKDQDGGGDDVVNQGNNNGDMQKQQQQMMPPRMVQTANEDDVDDDLTVDTLDNNEEEQCKQDDTPTPLTPAWGSTPTALATVGGMIKNAFSADNSMSVMSVSTFEKDAAALAALASKIGRKPSTQPKTEVVREEEINTTDSGSSCGTFEQDQKARMMTRKQVSPRMSIGEIVNNPSAQSTSTFEKDFQVRQPKPNLSAIGEAISGAVSRQASGAAAMFGSSFSPSQQQPAVTAQEVIPAPSNTAFERDSKPTVANPGWFATTTSSNNNRQDVSRSGFEKDVPSNMNNQHSNTTTNCEAGVLSVRSRSATSVKNIETDGLGTTRTGLSVAAREAAAEAEATLKLSKITPLAIKLSPAAIDKGVKKNKDSGGFWARFMCAQGV